MHELESLFFVFTTTDDVASWQLFRPYNSADLTTMSEIQARINGRIDRQLKDRVPENRRVYFRHSRRGQYLMPSDAKPSWKDVKGIIADLSMASVQAEHNARLVDTLTALAESALGWARIRAKVLACFIPSDQEPPTVSLDFSVIKVRRPEDSRQLEEAITAWLVDINFDAVRDRTGDDVELHKMADEYVESCLLSHAKLKGA